MTGGFFYGCDRKPLLQGMRHCPQALRFGIHPLILGRTTDGSGCFGKHNPGYSLLLR